MQFNPLEIESEITWEIHRVVLFYLNCAFFENRRDGEKLAHLLVVENSAMRPSGATHSVCLGRRCATSQLIEGEMYAP